VEGAAGSRYVTIPVTVRAETTTGREQRFVGSYTLRRSVVDGATPDHRQDAPRRAIVDDVGNFFGDPNRDVGSALGLELHHARVARLVCARPGAGLDHQQR